MKSLTRLHQPKQNEPRSRALSRCSHHAVAADFSSAGVPDEIAKPTRLGVQVSPPDFCNGGVVKKTGACVVHRARPGNQPPAFCTSISVGTTLQRLRLQARRSTSYTVCLDKFNSLAIIATFFFSRFILRIMVCTVGVTLLGMPLGLPPLFTGGGVPPALMIASMRACLAALSAAILSALISVS